MSSLIVLDDKLEVKELPRTLDTFSFPGGVAELRLPHPATMGEGDWDDLEAWLGLLVKKIRRWRFTKPGLVMFAPDLNMADREKLLRGLGVVPRTKPHDQVKPGLYAKRPPLSGSRFVHRLTSDGLMVEWSEHVSTPPAERTTESLVHWRQWAEGAVYVGPDVSRTTQGDLTVRTDS